MDEQNQQANEPANDTQNQQGTDTPGTTENPQPSENGQKGPENSTKGANEETEESTTQAPEYELKLDKESILTEDHLKDISEYAKEHKLSEKQAKSLLEMREDAVGRTHEGLKELHKTKVETWSKELGARKEFAEEKQWVDKAVNHFGTDDLYKTLKDTGYSNYPPLWDFLKGIGRALSNDSLVEGSPAGNDTGPKDLGDIMYPNMK